MAAATTRLESRPNQPAKPAEAKIDRSTLFRDLATKSSIAEKDKREREEEEVNNFFHSRMQIQSLALKLDP